MSTEAKRRIISFDLDDTLRLHEAGAPREPHRWAWLLRLVWPEPLRAGTVGLMRELVAMGWEIAIYTTSARKASYIRRWLRCYGIKVVLVVNDARHAEVVMPRFEKGGAPSKHPGLFGIDLHVDDSEGVAMEGARHGFRTVVVSPDDAGWAEGVLRGAAEVSER
jgi:hypothetical protein